MDAIGKIFQTEQGKRRCMVCEGLFTRQDAGKHATEPCEPTSAIVRAASAGQSA